jgi:MlaC protein
MLVPSPARAIVHSQIIKANGDPVKVDYLMRRNSEAWLISDIYLDGAISEVVTRRSKFDAILKSPGVDDLIATLNRKADVMTGTTAKAAGWCIPKASGSRHRKASRGNSPHMLLRRWRPERSAFRVPGTNTSGRAG